MPLKSIRNDPENKTKDRHVYFIKSLLKGKTFSHDDKYHYCMLHKTVVDLAHLQKCSCIPRGDKILDMLQKVWEAPKD